MKRRSKVSGGQVKGRRRKTPEPKRRNPPKGAPQLSSVHLPLRMTKVARLTHELRGGPESSRAATSEVLRVISKLPLVIRQPDSQAMLKKRRPSLCDAEFGNIYRWDGEALHLVATQNPAPRLSPRPVGSLTGRPGSKDRHRTHDCEQKISSHR